MSTEFKKNAKDDDGEKKDHIGHANSTAEVLEMTYPWFFDVRRRDVFFLDAVSRTAHSLEVTS